MARSTRIIIAFAIATLCGASTIAQQRKPPQPIAAGTSAIRGTITDAVSREPIAECTVRAALVPGIRFSTVTTAADGKYEFASIAEGSYSLSVECPGYLWGCVEVTGASRPLCDNATLFKDQKLSNLDFAVTPAATVRGRVIDSAGKPVKGAVVRIGGPFLGNQLIRVQTSETKADGSFEVGALPGGSWAFEVDIPPPPGAYRSPLIYYPGVLKRDEAGVVDVPAGKVTEGIVITVPPVLDHTLTVRVPPPDATMTDVIVSLVRPTPLMTRHLDIDAEGTAVVRGLIDGRYLVTVTALSDQQRWVDYQAFDFLDQPVDVSLQPQRAGRIRGRVIGDRGMPPLDNARVGATWVDGDVLLNPVSPEDSAIAADGSFEIDGVFGRRLLQLVRFDPDWRIHSVLEGRIDVTATGVQVTPGSTTEVTVIVRPR